MGARTLFTPDRLERFAQALELGSTIRHACAYAGFAERTYYGWQKDAEDNPDSPYAEILTIRREAEARGMMANLARIQKAAKEGTWQAAAWMLERKWPQDYGRRAVDHRAEIKVEGLEDAMRQAIRGLSDADLGIEEG